jgi:hypothetical protein
MKNYVLHEYKLGWNSYGVLALFQNAYKVKYINLIVKATWISAGSSDATFLRTAIRTVW